MADWLAVGQKAPAFTLSTDDGSQVRLTALLGAPLVVYFYPKDDTPGCTKEACAWRDCQAELTQLGVKLLGISPDTVESHAKFRDKHALNFPLLADPDHTVAESYGAWGEKTFMGRKSIGIRRSTFVIDREGKVAKAWHKVSVDGHDEQVLAALAKL